MTAMSAKKTSGSPSHKYPLGLIGNCAYSALINTEGNVSWLCWPRFDSSFIFGSLLDEKNGGEFSIRPANAHFTSTQSYLPNSNILCTRFESTDGVFELTDFAPRFQLFERYHKPLMLFRKVKKISGSPRIFVTCRPVGDYGRAHPQALFGSNHIRYEGLEQTVRLTTNASLTYIYEEKEFSLVEDLYLVLTWGVPLEGPLQSTFEDFLARTNKYWTNWVERCSLPRIFQKDVIRSALVLKLHQYEDTGAIIAACTTSLPEIPDQGRNWDYRYCWLRDTYYTLSALNSLSHFSEMQKYAHFIENLNLENLLNLQPVYRIDGSPEMTEHILPLQGYLDNQPVRIGNQAALQIQHDAYGQVLLALFSLYTDERLIYTSPPSSRLLKSILTYIERTMEIPDNGVWEFRGTKSVHSYTLLFHWAGSAAVRKIALRIGENDLVHRAEKCHIHAARLLENAYLPEKKAYAQSVGSKELDASMLQMITLGYLQSHDPQRALDHLAAIEKELEISPGFLVRYRHHDDFGAQKSAFLVCSFWHIEALVALGQTEKALRLFENLTQAQNHLGLMSEDFDVTTGSQWGNFPQTYSHVGLINCAFALEKALKKPPFL